MEVGERGARKEGGGIVRSGWRAEKKGGGGKVGLGVASWKAVDSSSNSNPSVHLFDSKSPCLKHTVTFQQSFTHQITSHFSLSLMNSLKPPPASPMTPHPATNNTSPMLAKPRPMPTAPLVVVQTLPVMRIIHPRPSMVKRKVSFSPPKNANASPLPGSPPGPRPQ